MRGNQLSWNYRDETMNGVPAPIPILNGLADIALGRKAWFCDIWGVLHDGLKPFPAAIEACRAFLKQGGEVVLVSNSPRTSGPVAANLDKVGVPHDCYTALVTSGDVTRRFVEAHAAEPMFHLGPDRDKCLFEGLKLQFVSARSAKVAVCTGFFDEDQETVEDYEPMLASLAARKVPMICANPDLIVERGTRIIPCAGLLAKRYTQMGQTVLQAGKPHAPIYEAARKKLSAPLPQGAILAIGDGASTDIEGACGQGIDAIYIASRVHMRDIDERGFTQDSLDGIFAGKPCRPLAAMAQLKW
jgi:HAD superfamily hydrolase (TIGR01459 family)